MIDRVGVVTGSRQSGESRMEVLEPRRLLAGHVWTGAVSDAWSDPGNWIGGAPLAGEQQVTLEFPSGAQRTSVRNDIPSLVVDQIQFGSAEYTIAGTAFTLNNTLEGGAANVQISASIVLGGDVNVLFNSPFATNTRLAFNGVLSGSGGLNLMGRGPVHFNANNTSIGDTIVSAGTLVVNGQHIAPISVEFGAVIAGRGHVGPLTVAGRIGNDLEVNRGQGVVIDPGIPYLGTPDVAGDLNLADGYFGVYFANDNGVSVAGTVDLTDARFRAVSNAAPTPGQVFTLIANDGVDPVVGTFEGISEGSLIEIYGHGYRVSYQGGDGNDVTLQAVSQPLTTRTLLTIQPVAGVAAVAQPVTLIGSIGLTGAGSADLAGGTVEFYSGTDLIGTATTGPNGHAAFTSDRLEEKLHTIRAVFVGNESAGLVGSTSTDGTLRIVQNGATTMDFAITPISGYVGESATLLVTVAGLGLPVGVPTGLVALLVDGEPLATVALDASGKASLTTADFPVGQVVVEAVYNGDGNFKRQSATASRHTRMLEGGVFPTRTTLSVSKTTARDDEPVRLVARVEPVAGTHSESFAGNVVFKIGTRIVGRAQLNSGGWAATDVILPVGRSIVTASYAGGNAYSPSDSTGVTVNIASTNGQPQPAGWRVAASVDVNNDGILDAVMRNESNGNNEIRLLNADGGVTGTIPLPATNDTRWNLDTAIDLTNDGSVDLFWRHSVTRSTLIWELNEGRFVAVRTTNAPVVAEGWRAVGGGDFNRDGYNDIVWYNDQTRYTSFWMMRGLNLREFKMMSATPKSDGWALQSIADYNGDGRPDLLWNNTLTGDNFAWYMDNTTVIGGRVV